MARQSLAWAVVSMEMQSNGLEWMINVHKYNVDVNLTTMWQPSLKPLANILKNIYIWPWTYILHVHTLVMKLYYITISHFGIQWTSKIMKFTIHQALHRLVNYMFTNTCTLIC